MELYWKSSSERRFKLWSYHCSFRRGRSWSGGAPPAVKAWHNADVLVIAPAQGTQHTSRQDSIESRANFT